jgi:hypothetical protein
MKAVCRLYEGCMKALLRAVLYEVRRCSKGVCQRSCSLLQRLTSYSTALSKVRESMSALLQLERAGAGHHQVA